MAGLLLAPYLAGAGDEAIGDWQLMPFGKVAEAEAVRDELREAVTRLVEAYKFDDSPGLGAVLYPRERRVGDEIQPSLVRPLRRALLAGTVAGNPPMISPDGEEEGNSGWGVATAENALVWCHPNIDPHSYVIETGTLSRVRSLRHAEVDEPLPKIDPPVELPRPMFARFDAELTDATARLLAADGDRPRRLALTLDWYAVVFSNAEAVTPEVRIGAARSALESLTDAGSESQNLVRAYGRLMRDEDSAETMYQPEEVVWAAKGPVPLTPDEWWLNRLSDLRNHIVHGDEVDDDLWLHNGQHQLDQVHDRLIQALRVVVADGVGDPHLRIPQGDRVFARMADEAYERLVEHDSDAAESGEAPADSADTAEDGEEETGG